jgi:hypothetical protein
MYTTFFQSKALKNLPKFGILFWEPSIWQPWQSYAYVLKECQGVTENPELWKRVHCTNQTNIGVVPRYSYPVPHQPDLDPILRLWNLKLQRQRCSRLELFFKVEENIFVFKTH